VPGTSNVCKTANNGFQNTSHEYQNYQSPLHEN
jgi:hypothetical protein